MGYLGGLGQRLCHGTRHLVGRNIALVVTLGLGPLIEQQDLFVVSQGHAPVLGHILSHADISRLHLPHLLILAHFQILLYLPYFASGDIPLDLNLDQQLAHHLILIVGQHEPVALYPRGRIMQLNIGLADFVAREIDRLLVESDVDLLPIRNLVRLLHVPLHRQRSLTVFCQFLVIEAKLRMIVRFILSIP